MVFNRKVSFPFSIYLSLSCHILYSLEKYSILYRLLFLHAVDHPWYRHWAANSRLDKSSIALLERHNNDRRFLFHVYRKGHV